MRLDEVLLGNEFKNTDFACLPKSLRKLNIYSTELDGSDSALSPIAALSSLTSLTATGGH